MYALRCTKRVLDRFQLRPHEGQPEESDTILGDWYANLLNVGRNRWVFCLSERSLLPVFVPARKDEFPVGLPAAVADTVARLGVDENARACEFEAMTRHSIGRTRSRSVLGVMTDLAFAAELGLRDGMSPVELSLWLARTPIKPIGYGSPDELTVELFAACGVA
jgi:Domain of unknown function (DUF6933)